MSKRNPLSDEAFIGWLEQQEPEARYAYTDGCGCALFHYFGAAGLRPARIGGCTWTDVDGAAHEIPPRWIRPLEQKPRTYGALAQRITGAAR